LPVFLLFAMAFGQAPAQSGPLQQGLTSLRDGKLAEARASFEKALQQNPRNAFGWVSLAETCRRLGDSKAANEAAYKAETFGAGNPVIDHGLAMYFAKAGQFGRAAELEQKFAGSGYADAEAEERVAGLFLDAGRLPEALAAAEKAAAQHPMPGAEDVLGRALIATGKTDEGEEHLRLAWDGGKTDSRLTFDYAQALLRRQDFSKAADVLSTALESHADDPQLVLALGVARYGQRRFDDAIAAFLRVIRLDPQVEQPYIFLGKMLDQAGAHLEEITAAYERWSAQNPRNAEGLLLLAKARLAGNSKDPTAENLLRRSINLDARNWEAHYELGVLLEGKHDWPEAAAELKRSAALDEKQAMPHYHLARVYDRLGEEEKAKAERALHEKLTGGGEK
jgi:tetratricopeptide (TPR) repeat protein